MASPTFGAEHTLGEKWAYLHGYKAGACEVIAWLAPTDDDAEKFRAMIDGRIALAVEGMSDG